MTKDNKVIYCDDEILRVTKGSKDMEFDIENIGKIELEKNVIYFYDLQGKCFGTAKIDYEKHKTKIDKMKSVINIKDIEIDISSKKIYKDKLIIKTSLFVIFILILVIVGLNILISMQVKKEDLDEKIELIATKELYKNSIYENNSYSVELESTNNDGAVFFIYECLRSLKEYKNIKKVENIELTSVNKDRQLYKIKVSGEQIYNWNLEQLSNYEPKQIISALNIKPIKPFIMKWKKIADFKGSSMQKTSNFTIKSDNARIKWNTWSHKDYGDFNFMVFMYFSNGDIADPYGIANVIGTEKGESYIKVPGTYYFDINTAQGYNIIVEEEVKE